MYLTCNSSNPFTHGKEKKIAHISVSSFFSLLLLLHICGKLFHVSGFFSRLLFATEQWVLREKRVSKAHTIEKKKGLHEQSSESEIDAKFQLSFPK